MTTYNIDNNFQYVSGGRRELTLAALGIGSHDVVFSAPIAPLGQPLPTTRGWIIEGIEVEADAASDLVIAKSAVLVGPDDPTMSWYTKAAGTAYAGVPLLAGYALSDGEALTFTQTAGTAKIKVRMRVDT